jgi:signal transduction histidine kinase
MTPSLAPLLAESRRAFVYMQLPVVAFLAIASFQARRTRGRDAFVLAGYGWILNLGYILLSSGVQLLRWPTLANAFDNDALANLVDAATGGCFILAYLAAHGTRLWPPWERRDMLAAFLFAMVGWFCSVIALPLSNTDPLKFVSLSAFLVVFNLGSRILLGKAFFELTKTEVPVGQGPKHLYAACLFYAIIQPIYLFQKWPDSQTIGFFLGFVAKVAIAIGFVKLFNGLTLKFASEQRSLDMARRILGRIRHELNTPLGELKNWIDAAMVEAANHGKLRQHLQRMESATQRALAITSVRDDVLYLAVVRQTSLDEETASTAKEVLNINNLVQTAMLAVKTTRSEEINWQVSFAAGNCIYCAREQVIQILVNLIRNAYDAMPNSRGRITVTTGQVNKGSDPSVGETRSVGVSIKDDGAGFDKSIRELAFNEGFTTRKGDGRGHGLAIVRQLLALNEGSMEVVSPWRLNDNKRPGTEVTLLFPAVRCNDGGGTTTNRG